MAAPTFIQEAETAWDTSTTPKGSGNFTTQTDDVVVAAGVTEDTAGTPQAATGTNVSLTSQQEVSVTDYTGVEISAGVVAAGGTTSVSFARGAGAVWFGGNALTFRDSDGIGASAKTNVSSGAPSLNITTTQDNSAIVVAVGDWAAVDGASRTWRTVNGITPTAGNGYERTYFRNSSHYSLYIAYYPDAGAAGSKTVGLSAPSGQKYSIVALEVLGTAGGGAITGTAAITLAAITAAATGTLPLAGSAAITLGAITSTGVGAIALKGAAGITLGAVTLSATGGATPNNGAAALTLDATTVSAAGVLPIAGAAAITLGAVTTTAAGQIALAGAAAVTLANVTTTAAGAVANTGAAAVTLGATTVAAEGVLSQPGSGQAAVTLADATISAAGTVAVAGAASLTLDAVTTSATGTTSIVGAASITLDAVTVAAQGSDPTVTPPEPAPVQGPGFFSGGPYEPIKKTEPRKPRIKAPKRAPAQIELQPISASASITLDAVSVSATVKLGFFTQDGLKRTTPKPLRSPLPERVAYLEREVSALRRALSTQGQQKER